MAEIEWIRPEALLVEELGVQSIDVVQIVERLEAELGCTLTGLDLGGVQTVAQLYQHLMAARKQSAPSRPGTPAGFQSASGSHQPHELALGQYLPEDVCADASTLLGALQRQAARVPEAPACLYKGTTTTYRQLAAAVAQLAGALAQAGVQHGDRVVIVMPNHPSVTSAWHLKLHEQSVAHVIPLSSHR